jgi:diaminohydroxyphosphoribosylaminopyrimidine deaminase/5-amino-6-(5-phosphoribosylamino)uracil reductase
VSSEERTLFGFFLGNRKVRVMGDEKYMERALELARRGAGTASPNPMVGAVVVRGGDVVGEGFHARPGDPHAEVLALRAAGNKAAGADLYVNLEPCCHHGRTPPCTEAIRESGIARVFAAIEDPNPLVAGKGGALLRDHGIPVSYGFAAAAALRLNEAYLKHSRTGLPFVFIKSAVTLDGKIATRTGDSRWITGESERALVHEMRNAADAILTGIGTVLADDPRLTARIPRGRGRDPRRVVVDPMLRIPMTARVLVDTGTGDTIIVASSLASRKRADELEALGARVLFMGRGRVKLPELMALLGEEGITSLMIEAGAEISASALDAGIVDKIVYFVAPKIVGGRDAPGAVGGDGAVLLKDAIVLRNVTYTQVGDSMMVVGYIGNGHV